MGVIGRVGDWWRTLDVLHARGDGMLACVPPHKICGFLQTLWGDMFPSWPETDLTRLSCIHVQYVFNLRI